MGPSLMRSLEPAVGEDEGMGMSREAPVVDGDASDAAGVWASPTLGETVDGLKAVPLFTEENARRPVPAIMLFLFKEYCRPRAAGELQRAACRSGELEKEFEAWYGQVVGEDPGVGQAYEQQEYSVRHRRVKAQSGWTVQRKVLGKQQYRRDLMSALLVTSELPRKQGTIYERRLKDDVARLCFFHGRVSYDEPERSAQECWTMLCQQREQVPALLQLGSICAMLSAMPGAFPKVRWCVVPGPLYRRRWLSSSQSACCCAMCACLRTRACRGRGLSLAPGATRRCSRPSMPGLGATGLSSPARPRW